MRVLIAGATGHLGRHVVREAKERGMVVRALARDASRLGPVRSRVDETVVARVTEPESLAGVADGVDTVISTLGMTRQRDGLTFMDVDFAGNVALLEEARRAGVTKFVYVAVYDPPGMERLMVVRAKRAFVERLRASGLESAVLYPTGFFSDMDEFLAMARRGRAWVFGDGRFRSNPIHGADLAIACVDAIDDDALDIPIGGPEVLTHEEIARAAFAAVGRPPRITRVPLWVRNAARGSLRTLAPASVKGQLEFLLTVLGRDLVAPRYGHRRLADHFRAATAAKAA